MVIIINIVVVRVTRQLLRIWLHCGITESMNRKVKDWEISGSEERKIGNKYEELNRHLQIVEVVGGALRVVIEQDMDVWFEKLGIRNCGRKQPRL